MWTLLMDNAKNNKNDEFYTQLTDIEKNWKIIKNILKIKWYFVIVMIRMKVIFKYFAMNFNYFGLKSW